LRANHAAARRLAQPAKSLRVQVDVYETLILAAAGAPRRRIGGIVYQISAYCVQLGTMPVRTTVATGLDWGSPRSIGSPGFTRASRDTPKKMLPASGHRQCTMTAARDLLPELKAGTIRASTHDDHEK